MKARPIGVPGKPFKLRQTCTIGLGVQTGKGLVDTCDSKVEEFSGTSRLGADKPMTVLASWRMTLPSLQSELSVLPKSGLSFDGR